MPNSINLIALIRFVSAHFWHLNGLLCLSGCHLMRIWLYEKEMKKIRKICRKKKRKRRIQGSARGREERKKEKNIKIRMWTITEKMGKERRHSETEKRVWESKGKVVTENKRKWTKSIWNNKEEKSKKQRKKLGETEDMKV